MSLPENLRDVSAEAARRVHGGAPEMAAKLFGIRHQDWLDLSTGINRCPYPVPQIPQHVWRDLPAPEAITGLKRAARDCYGANNAAIIAAHGSQSLIQALPQIALRRALGSVAVISPTYHEHSATWRDAGFTVSETGPSPAHDADVVVAVNPNNPDGRLLEPDRLRTLADRQAEKGGLLIVDEAFCDLTPEISLAPDAGRPGLVMLRSVGKFFGLAGLRLGFALTSTGLARELENALGPWAVSGPSVLIGTTALTDDRWITETRAKLTTKSRRMEEVLADAGLRKVAGTDLFKLIEHPKARTLHETLARQGIWTRIFENLPNRLRIGIPGPDAEWTRIERALQTAMEDLTQPPVRPALAT